MKIWRRGTKDRQSQGDEEQLLDEDAGPSWEQQKEEAQQARCSCSSALVRLWRWTCNSPEASHHVLVCAHAC